MTRLSTAVTRLYLMVPTAALVEASIDINLYAEPRQSKHGCGDCEENKSADDQQAFLHLRASPPHWRS